MLLFARPLLAGERQEVRKFFVHWACPRQELDLMPLVLTSLGGACGLIRKSLVVVNRLVCAIMFLFRGGDDHRGLSSRVVA